MIKMTPNERMDMEATVLYHLTLAMDDEAAIKVADSKNSKGISLMEDVIDDIKTSSDWENDGHYNDDDVRLAIGRVFMSRFGVEV